MWSFYWAQRAQQEQKKTSTESSALALGRKCSIKYTAAWRRAESLNCHSFCLCVNHVQLKCGDNGKIGSVARVWNTWLLANIRFIYSSLLLKLSQLSAYYSIYNVMCKQRTSRWKHITSQHHSVDNSTFCHTLLFIYTDICHLIHILTSD